MYLLHQKYPKQSVELQYIMKGAILKPSSSYSIRKMFIGQESPEASFSGGSFCFSATHFCWGGEPLRKKIVMAELAFMVVRGKGWMAAALREIKGSEVRRDILLQ